MKPSLASIWNKTRRARFLRYVYAYKIKWNVNCWFKKKTKNQHVHFFLVGKVSKSQNICACADGMFEQEKKTQYLQTPALERRTKRVIPGFRPVRSLLDAVGPSLLSVTHLASRYGIEGEICRPLNHMWQIPRLLTAPNRPCQYSVRIRWLIYLTEKSFSLSYSKQRSRRLQSVRMRPAKGNTHTYMQACINFISSLISE